MSAHNLYRYSRIAPSAPHLEKHEPITRAEFKAEIARDRFNLDNYEENSPGKHRWTAQAYRFMDDRKIPLRCSPPEPPLVAAMDAAETQLAPLTRLFTAVREGLDEPELLILAVTRLRAAVELLEAVTATMTSIDHPALVPTSGA